MEEGKGETVQRTGIPGSPSPDSSDGEVDRLEEPGRKWNGFTGKSPWRRRGEQTASELGRRAWRTVAWPRPSRRPGPYSRLDLGGE